MTTNSFPTLWVVGDSTVSAFADSYYLPRYGYGTQLGRYLNSGVRVVNLALPGRSSKSFTAEQNYARFVDGLSQGDFVVIGFGHNDQKREAERFTSPVGGVDDQGSFAHSLYHNYILPARERGATPVLCTPVVRLSEEDDYSGVCGHITPTVGQYQGGDYPAAIRALGRAAGVEVVDLTCSSMARYLKCGHVAAQNFHAWAATSGGRRVGLDGTHLNKYGAALTAYEWAVAIKNSSCPLKQYLLPQLCPPDKEELADAVNRDYREPVYEPFCGQSGDTFKLPSPWYGTAMGDIGGQGSVPQFTVEGVDNGFVVGNSSVVPRGKAGASSDGFAAAFRQLSACDNFICSCKCTVLSVGDEADGQTAFGLMLRDDIYVDKYVPALSSNYVAAGVFGGYAIARREGGALIKGEECGKISAGRTFELNITRVNQQITASVNGLTQKLFDFDLAAVDGQYDYICLFACRHVSVRFTDICLRITGRAARA